MISKEDISDLNQSVGTLGSDFIEAVIIIYCIHERLTGGRGREVSECCKALRLGHNVAFVAELVVPHEVWLLPGHLTQYLHVRINAQPENGRVSAKKDTSFSTPHITSVPFNM